MTIEEIKDLNGGTLNGLDAEFIEMLKDTPATFVEELIKKIGE